ncbi:MAG: TRAP transporter substrate-binding protein [Methylobacteriaceae bacterium]|jgi:tripartite ATP-independent transporter DctP family solute receptor|nr:TRAP transporter substrate-binding protein [Methylobacteriaceae bacterium]
MNKLSVFVAALLAGTMLIPGEGSAQTYKTQTIMAASANTPGSNHGVLLNRFKDIVEKESNGAITVKVYLGGTMGDEAANVKQLRNEELHIATLFTGNLTPNAPTANVLCLPYLFTNMEQAYAVLSDQDFRKELADDVAKESGARPLGWMIGGWRSITNSKKPITKLEDLQGLKIRVSPTAMQLAAFRAWGIEPHPMAWSEVFNALQQGVVDGQENMYVTNRDNKFWEVQKYMTEIHYMLWIGSVLVSDSWYQKLDADTKALVEKAVITAQNEEWANAEKEESDSKKLTLEHGMEVTILDPQEEERWKEKARGVWPEFVNTPEMKSLSEKALAIIAAMPKK